MNDDRFNYEPVFGISSDLNKIESFKFLEKKITTPIWVSSMTGGISQAIEINKNLALACKEFGMGMGLGSCRKILYSNEKIKSFKLRKYIGYNLPLYANLGIAQIEEIINKKKYYLLKNLVDKVEADGLIIHINPLQEIFQKEGDLISIPPLNLIKQVLEKINFPLIIKEVGQGFGPKSLKKLLELPLEGIEFGAFGGTNFSKLEITRNNSVYHNCIQLCNIGHTAAEMVDICNNIYLGEGKINCKQIIISGGIDNFLDGFYLMKKSKLPAIYGQASTLLKYAQKGYDSLKQFLESQRLGLKICNNYFTLKK